MFNEPPITPDDTRPTQTVPVVKVTGEMSVVDSTARDTGDVMIRRIPLWQRLMGGILLLAAAGLTVVTALLLATPVTQQVVVVTSTPTQSGGAAVAATVTPATDVSPTRESLTVQNDSGLLPTLSIDGQVALLQTPVSAVDTFGGSISDVLVVRDTRNPFTIIPDRPRDRVEQYTIVKGDTINDIAARFGLTPETIAWSNDRRSIWVLTPGATLNILPVDGVYHQAVGNATMKDIAAQYGVSDPMTIIDSPYNQLFGMSPDDAPPSGLWMVIPGGTAEAINWSPTVQVTGGGGGAGGGGDGQVSFDPSSPGSCGAQNPGISTGWQRPLNSYTFMRGFSSYHTGVDLATPIGTPVAAANGGRVIFAGRSNWGFGNLVVLSHGPFVSLYGHLSSVSVSCGELVSAGQIIAASGNTGNSSGPHLHFEIQYNGVPTNPTDILPF